MKTFKTIIATGTFLMILSAAFLLAGCDEDDTVDEIICTEEFRMIGVRITGGEIDDFYTVRISNGDTIRFSQDTYPLVNWYPILDDSYQPVLEGTVEDFTFVGVQDGNLVIQQNYEIGADQCHIFRQSGPQSITL